MGKKIKVGKQRRDKYYRLAKESGYRSRAAFKLVQLNRKFAFLPRSQVLVDLCAAPGGWLQVATQFMPVSSLIIGVDLMPIKPIPRVLTLQDDITTDRCKKAIQNELKSLLADCVLHDGAPNVGQNWIHDAFMQAQLTLSAIRVAISILRKGGWFITKVFRSKDHPALIPVLSQLFRKVHVTKPAASRLESAEIFVVCEGFLKPAKVDAKLLDVNTVFGEVAMTKEQLLPKLDLIHPNKMKKAKAEGYTDGHLVICQDLQASEFIRSENHLELLSQASAIVIDSEQIDQHSSTTNEIKECCRDIRVLGRKEIKSLLAWRKTLRQHLGPFMSKPSCVESEDLLTPNKSTDDDEETALCATVDAAAEEERKVEKRKKRKDQKMARTLKEKIKLQMVLPGDRPDFTDSQELFNLSRIHQNELDNVVNVDTPHDDETDELEQPLMRHRAGLTRNNPSVCVADAERSYFGARANVCAGHASMSPLIVDLDPSSIDEKERRRMDLWFARPSFVELTMQRSEDDADVDLDELSNIYQKKTSRRGEEEIEDQPLIAVFAVASPTGNSPPEKKRRKCLELSESNDFVMDTANDDPQSVGFPRKLAAEELALGELLTRSSKSAREVLEWGYNRFVNNDDNLPEWFVEDERKHHRKPLPVTKDRVAVYKQRLLELNARPIKKVVEAKARKKKRALRKLERIRKRADAVAGNSELSEKEKAEELRKFQRQAKASTKKPEVTYVVAKKGLVGRRVRRPAGVAGRFKMVDPRLKKDLRKSPKSKTKKPFKTKKRR